jgi:hypothetical protein
MPPVEQSCSAGVSYWTLLGQGATGSNRYNAEILPASWHPGAQTRAPCGVGMQPCSGASAFVQQSSADCSVDSFDT